MGYCAALDLAEQGNISRASETLHISQPALTRALQEFETQLGVMLFLRSTRKRRFALSHPAVKVRLVEDNSLGITARVTRSEVDFGIGSPVGDTGPLLCQRLLSAPLGLLADGTIYPLKPRMSQQQIAALPLLKEAADTSIVQLLRTRGSDIVGQMDKGIEVSSLALQLALVRAGLGVAVLSALGASHPQAQGLCFVPLRPAILREVFMLQRRDRAPSPSARALLRAIVSGLQHAALHPAVKVVADSEPGT